MKCEMWNPASFFFFALVCESRCVTGPENILLFEVHPCIFGCMSVEEARAGGWGENVRVRFLRIYFIFIILISQEMLQAGAVKGCVWIWLQQFLPLHMYHKLNTEVRSTPSLALAKYQRCWSFKVYVHTLHAVTCLGAYFWTLCPENMYGYSCSAVVQPKGTFTKWHRQNNRKATVQMTKSRHAFTNFGKPHLHFHLMAHHGLAH